MSRQRAWIPVAAVVALIFCAIIATGFGNPAFAARLTSCSSVLMRSDPTRYTVFDSFALSSRLRPIMSILSCATIASIGTVG